eukprot:359919-Chlamydomonas_euryale.AAC.10
MHAHSYYAPHPGVRPPPLPRLYRACKQAQQHASRELELPRGPLAARHEQGACPGSCEAHAGRRQAQGAAAHALPHGACTHQAAAGQTDGERGTSWG